MKLEKYISDLLYRHDCVIVPGLGGFIVNPKSAFIHPVQHTFFPPSKEIVFNAGLKTNDGLLANFLAMARGTSFEDAMSNIEDAVNQWQIELKEQGCFSLSGIGQFTLNAEKNLQFDPESSINYLEDAYGLGGFMSPIISREESRRKILFADRKIHLQKRYAGVIIRRITAVSIPVAAMMIWSIFNWNMVTNVYTSNAGFLSFLRYSAKVNTEMPATPAKKIVVNNASILPVAESKSAEEVTVANLKYFIIGGAFQNEENAQNFVKKLQSEGYHASILDKTRQGLFRVSVEGYANMEEATSHLGEIQQNINNSAWILNK